MKPLRVLQAVLCMLCLAAAFTSSASASSDPYIPRHGVNFATGNKFLHQNDISLAGPVSNLVFSRNYNSQSVDLSVLGYGWTFSFNDRLTFENGVPVYTQSDGRRIRFVASGTDRWGK